MRTYPHKPNWSVLDKGRDGLRTTVQSDFSQFNDAVWEEQRRICNLGLRDALDLARLEYANEAPTTQIKKLFADFCNIFSKAPDLDVRFHPDDYMEYLSVAVLHGDVILTELLAGERGQVYRTTDL